MVLLIIIPFLNGAILLGIYPTFSDKHQDCPNLQSAHPGAKDYERLT